MKAVVFGYHTIGCIGLDALLRHGFEVPGVITHLDDPGEEIWWDSLADRATARGIPVYRPGSVRDPSVRDLVASMRPDFIFSFYYRRMIPAGVLALAREAALNLHGSLLPRYRGRAPVNWVLVHGETETGVSLHHMIGEPDAGDLVGQERVAIAFEDTAFTLHAKLAVASARLLDRFLPALRSGNARSDPMDLTRGSYFGRRTAEDGAIDWSWSAVRAYNLVRAVTHPYPGAFASHRGRRLRVWWGLPGEAREDGVPGTVLESGREGITIATGEGALRLVTVQLEGDPEQPASAFALSEGIVPGERLDGGRSQR